MNLPFYKPVVLFSFLLSATTCFGQMPETIQSDRPGQGSTPVVVGKDVLQIQSGWEYNKSIYSNGKVELTSHKPQLMLRYGLGSKLEFNAAFYHMNNHRFIADFGTKNYSSKGFLFGARYNILTSSTGRPLLTISESLNLDGSFDQPGMYFAANRTTLSSAGSITTRLSYLVNFGWKYDHFNKLNSFNHVANVSFQIGKKWNVFIENYGSYIGEYRGIYFDYGAAYLISPNFQLDVFGSFGSGKNHPDSFINAGFSYRIPKLGRNKSE